MADRKDVKEGKERTPLETLHFYCSRGDRESAVELIGKDKKLVTAKGNLENTALHWAAGAGHDDIVVALIDAKADLKAVNAVGDTALHCAVWKDQVSTVQLLLSKGADKNAKNKAGKAPYELAKGEEMQKVLPALNETEIASMITIAAPEDENDDDEEW